MFVNIYCLFDKLDVQTPFNFELLMKAVAVLKSHSFKAQAEQKFVRYFHK